jgi:hypothetical protein
MKKLLLLAGLGVCTMANAQSFTDNFDSYTAGSYMAAQSAGAWTTWSGAPGTTEDVLVSNANSISGSNSVYFSTSSSSGGPTDLVRNFGVLNTGQFSMNFNLLVETGKAGYFNFQRNATIGQTWAMDCFFTDNGNIQIQNQSGLSFSASYPQGNWFNFRIDINFNTNHWEVFVDNVSVGSFANTENQIASIDIYPTDQASPYSCGYFMDDFHYDVTPYTMPALNGAANLVSFAQAAIVGNAVTPVVTIRNLGTSTINSAKIDVDYNGTNVNTTVSGLNLASSTTTTVTLPSTLLLVGGVNAMVATISNVNGSNPDGDTADDQTTIMVDPFVAATGKVVVTEEGTGTWCQWCPRGAVFMDRMAAKYGDYWAGIAVHNGTNDPMKVTEYDTPFATLIGGSFPSTMVDRTNVTDPSEMEPDIVTRLQVAPTAFITNGATWDPATRLLTVSVSANFQAAANSNYKLAVVLTEDDVTGTTSGYAQSNAYSGGGSGPMGGFESLGNPVPAAQMVYNHVARAIEPSFTGYDNSFPAVVNSGDVYSINASFVLPATWDETKIDIIGMMIAPDGTIDNAGKATIAEAVANGFVAGTDMTASIDASNQIDALVQVAPNPATDHATISLNILKESNVIIQVIDLAGNVLTAKNYGKINCATNISLNTSNYPAGIYYISVTLDNEVVQQRLVIE